MKQTTLDLNGPILGFSTHPQNVTVNNAGIATFIGIATAYFTSQNPTNIFSSNTGVVTHRWYAAGIGVLSDGTNTTLGATLSGTATTTLTVSSATSNIQLFVGADYVPSAYQTTSPITAGTGRSTGNAINEILFSNTATLTVNPFVSISAQPSSSTVAQGQTATFSVTATSSNNTAVAYQWYIGGSPVSNGTSGGNTISGANTNILTVTTSSSTPVGTSNVFVSVSHPTAGNSPVVSNIVVLGVVLPRAILNFESLSVSSSTAILSNVNLETTSAFTYNATTFGNPILCFYAPEKNINLELEIFASKGLDFGGYSGGQGGYSKIRFTARQNEEYVITPLSQENQGSGVFIYRKAALIAVVGSGGNSGSGGNGGNGGGINIGGASGSGRSAGAGGAVFSAGSLPSTGVFGSVATQEPYAGTGDTKASAPNVGRVLPCARGRYWRNLGYSACQDLGNIQFFTDSGVRVTNTATISRGHKIGYDIRQTSGAGSNGGGIGGQGATGGQGGLNGGGGGGGSGYSDGSITIISTRQGGSILNPRVVFRLSTPNVVGQQEYTSPGTYTWIAPSGVFSVSVVAIGGGNDSHELGGGGNAGYCSGGGGGGLGWKNSIPVVPGQSYTVVVGDAGYIITNNNYTRAGNSYFISISTVAGFGGGRNLIQDINADKVAVAAGGTYFGDGGGNGGNGGIFGGGQSDSTTGGGGAGGYTGNGGDGGGHASSGLDGQGGGGGGGMGNYNGLGGGRSTSGGGVGLHGQGSSGVGAIFGSGNGGGGGSGGFNGQYGTFGSNGGSSASNYGGGAGLRRQWAISQTAGSGAVRIIWGENRAFPSLNTINL